MSIMIDLDDPRVVHLLCNLEPRWKPMDEVNGEDFKELNNIIGEFERFSVDAEPVRHGHWIYNKDTGEIRCNLCNALVGVTMYPDDVELITEVENFCFNCGAKMDEVSK